MNIDADTTSLQWQRAQQLFWDVADLAPADRARILDRECAGDAPLREEVESLLDHDASSEKALDETFSLIAFELLSDPLCDPLVGERAGAYRIVSELGHGGMGAVYLAVRADDAFSKKVAIKVVKRGMDSTAMLEGFFKERQILASLDHPYIARLMDAGSTSGHQPFFVMEYVEGRAIDEFCKEQKLGAEQICSLFRRVSEAVSYAHRNLVVHRDLKPGNILITPDGSPKLLDFGIAKLLSAGPVENSTVTGLAVRPFTPEYASPEQISGRPVNTSTDVYSLGAVLYELLTGSRARPDTVRPSSLNRKLPQDLDNILLKALHHEPERRYSSVEQFSADLGRFLDGLPVLARQDSFGYRAGKYASRHRVGIAAALLVLASLLTGTVVAIRAAEQAKTAQRIAEQERARAEEHSHQADLARESTKREHLIAVQEAANARSAQARAEQRLAELIELANRTLFDVHHDIESLQGATAARRAIVKTTLEYLQKLALDAPHDEQLRLTLATAYMRVGDVQGNPNIASLGDTAGALESYRRATDFLSPLPAPGHTGSPALHILGELIYSRAAVLINAGQSAETIRMIQRFAPWTAELAVRDPDSDYPATIQQMAMLALQSSHPDQAAIYGRQSILAYEKLQARNPHTDEGLALSATHSILAAILRPANLEEALIHYRESVKIREALVAREPDNADYRRKLMIAYGQTANAFWDPYSVSLQDADGAAAYYTKALAMARQLRQADPVNRVAQYDLAAAELRLAAIPGGAKNSLELLLDSRGLLENLEKADPKSLRYLRNLSMVYEHLGNSYVEEGKSQEGLAEYRKSLAAADRVLTAEPADNVTEAQALAALRGIAMILATQGDRAGALESARQASSRGASAPEASGGVLRARGELTLALVESQLGDWAEARQAASLAAQQWRHVIASHRDASSLAELGRAEQIIAEADAHLK